MAGWAKRFGRQLRRVLVPAVLAVGLGTPPALANGWEHWGIPLEVLLESLDGDDPGYRLKAARSLGIRRERAAVARLLEILRDGDEPAWVRAEVIQALGSIGDARAADDLLAVLRGDLREELRSAAALALGRLALPGTVDALIQALQTDRSLIVRADVVAALGAFREAGAIAALVRLVEGKATASLRPRAIRALGRTGSRQATASLLSALAAARSETEQIAIVDALTEIADPAARAALERLFGKTESPALKVRITVALGAIQDGSAVPKLIELLASDLAAVRYFAVDALAASGEPGAAEPLRRLYWRASAAERPGPGEGDRRQVVAYLAEHSLRLVLVRALTRLDPAGSAREFLHAAAARDEARDSAIGLRLAEGTYELRRAAIVGLGYSGDDGAARYLVEGGVLSDRDFRLRATALRALGVLRVSTSAAAVMPLLDDDKPEVRWVAAKVLGRLGADAALPRLRGRLDDPHPEVRRQAVLSLGYLGDRTSCSGLLRLVRADPEGAVSDAARATRTHLCRSN